jgi:hypothetical protein
LRTKFSTEELTEWVSVWPIVFTEEDMKDPRKCWKTRLVGLEYVKNLLYFNRRPSGRRVTMKAAHRLISKNGWREGTQHYYRSIAREVKTPKPLVVYHGKVIDGNHTALALVERNYPYPIMIIEFQPRQPKKGSEK